jgi:hypothetical protein
VLFRSGEARPQIKSRNSLFEGDMVDKPMAALVVGEDHEGFAIYACPRCGNRATVLECDVLGAEPGCSFCNQCHTEFET